MLYEMTFAQLLSLIQTRNLREIRAHEEAERRAKMERDGYAPPPPRRNLNDPENLPSVSEVMSAFGGVMG